MEPRIAPLTDPDEEQLASLAKVPHNERGQAVNLFATLAHRPRLMARVNGLGGCLALDCSLRERERELVILRAAANAGCSYEIGHHRATGRRAGLTADEIDAVISLDGERRWSTSDQALLDVVDELSRRADVSDGSWTALDGVLEQDARIDLLILVGFYRMIGGFINGARIEFDG
jgi:4-carboxymuconolactone decarboxylase